VTNLKYDKAWLEWTMYVQCRNWRNNLFIEGIVNGRKMLCDLLVGFIRELRHQRKFFMTNINGILAGVRSNFVNQGSDYCSVFSSETIVKAKKAATSFLVDGEFDRQRDERMPIPLEFILAERESSLKGSLLDRMTFIGCYLAFHLCMRIGEFASVGRVSPHILLAKNVRFEFRRQSLNAAEVSRSRFELGQLETVVIHIYSDKTHRVGQGSYHAIDAINGSCNEIELTHLLKEWALLAKMEPNDPFFRVYSKRSNGLIIGKTLQSSEVKRWLSAIAQKRGLKATEFGCCHVLRIGAAAALDAAGIDPEMINHIGRWASNSTAAVNYRKRKNRTVGALSFMKKDSPSFKLAQLPSVRDNSRTSNNANWGRVLV